MKWLLVMLAALLLCGAIAAVGAWHVVTENLEPVAARSEPVIFSVQGGETLKAVASRLETDLGAPQRPTDPTCRDGIA